MANTEPLSPPICIYYNVRARIDRGEMLTLGGKLERCNGSRRVWISISLQFFRFYLRVYECIGEDVKRTRRVGC